VVHRKRRTDGTTVPATVSDLPFAR
jgi:hypothetical protein